LGEPFGGDPGERVDAGPDANVAIGDAHVVLVDGNGPESLGDGSRSINGVSVAADPF